MNFSNKIILRSYQGNAARAINLVNNPLPFTQTTRISQLNAGNDLGFNLAFNTGFAMAYVTAMFVMFYIKERVTRAKLLQFVSGVNKVIFWLTSFVVDYAVFILISLLFVGVLAAYQKEGFSTLIELTRIFIILIVFGFSALPFTYVWSLIFQVPSSGLVRLSIGYVISGVFLFLAYFILNNEFLGLQHIARPLGWIFLIFPHYSLTRGLSNLNLLQSTISICETQCSFLPLCSTVGVETLCEISPFVCGGPSDIPEVNFICNIQESCCNRDIYGFNETGIGINLVALGMIGIISFIILFTIEYRWVQNLFNKLRKEKR